MKYVMRVTMICAALAVVLYLPAALSAADVKAVYFYSASCSQCRYVSEKIIPPLKAKYGDRLEFDTREVGSEENLRLLLEMERKAGREIDKRPPLIFIGDDILEGRKAIASGLAESVARYAEKGGTGGRTAGGESSSRAVADKFRSLGIIAVITGGLLDGINPCAFATLIFLISYLAYAGRKGRDLIISGICYTAGVFSAYFGIGIGLFEFARIFPAFETVGKAVMLFIAGGALALGILSVYDWVMIRKGRASEMKLQLSAFFKKRIHSSIRTGTRRGGLIISSVTAGFLIGLFEFPCTGQVYFPIIVVIREISELRAQGILYLLLYNALFVLPLVVVFVLVYKGLTSDELAKLMKRRMALVKILTAVFFIAVALLLAVPILV